MRQETEVNFLVRTVILGYLSIFKKSQASSPYEALNSLCLSRGQRDVRPHIQMRRTSTAFSRVSTGDSDMPSSCEMKEEKEKQEIKVEVKVEVSWFSSSCGGNLVYILELRQG